MTGTGMRCALLTFPVVERASLLLASSCGKTPRELDPFNFVNNVSVSTARQATERPKTTHHEGQPANYERRICDREGLMRSSGS